MHEVLTCHSVFLKRRALLITLWTLVTIFVVADTATYYLNKFQQYFQFSNWMLLSLCPQLPVWEWETYCHPIDITHIPKAIYWDGDLIFFLSQSGYLCTKAEGAQEIVGYKNLYRMFGILYAFWCVTKRRKVRDALSLFTYL